MERIYKSYKKHVEFFLVYIREAHPDSVLYVTKNDREVLEKITQTATLKQRNETAKVCSASLQLSIPTLVDKQDNEVNEAYAGWPDSMAVVGVDGRIAYYGGRGPGGFKPRDVEQWLKNFRSTSAN